MKKFFSLCILDPLKALPIILFYSMARLLPVDLSSKLFGSLAGALGPYLKVHKLGHKNLTQAFPKKSPEEINKILKGVWENLGRIAGEFPHSSRIARNPKRIQIVGQKIFEEAITQNRPILFMAGHLGNWEIPMASSYPKNIPLV